MAYDCTEDMFLKDVSGHEMTVFKDEGVHRHIRFAIPGAVCMHFDLITWPGYLCYTGDMGTYVFRRLNDMFEFFRTDKDYAEKNGKTLSINIAYWSEKVEAKDLSGDIKEFDEHLFRRAVIGDLVEWMRDNRSDTSKDERRDLWDAVMADVIYADDDSGGYRKQCAAHDFSYRVNKEVGDFEFRDFWERTVEDYTSRFVWCCYALTWGIQKYDDESKKIGSEV